jgi:proline iminopeptidase
MSPTILLAVGEAAAVASAEVFVARGDRRFYCAIDRPASLAVHVPTLLVLHGGPGYTHDYLRPWLGQLGDEFRVVHLDLPGAGRSSRHAGSGYPLEDYVSDIEAIRAHLETERLLLVGHAWGALLATEYALAHPGRAAGIAMINPLRILRAEGQDQEAQARMIRAVDPDVVTPYVETLWPLIQQALGGDFEAWAAVDADPWWARMWRTCFASAPPPSWNEATRAMRWGLEAYFAHKGAAFLSADHPLNRYDLAERASALRAPLLIVASNHDANYIAPAGLHARPLHAALRGSELLSVEDAGHFPFVEQTEIVLDALRAFARRVARES